MSSPRFTSFFAAVLFIANIEDRTTWDSLTIFHKLEPQQLFVVAFVPAFMLDVLSESSSSAGYNGACFLPIVFARDRRTSTSVALGNT